MPRNLYSATCLHTLYDSGCGLVRGTYATAEPPARFDRDADHLRRRLASHVQGTIVFTSGANANVRATVKLAAAGASLTLIYPLPAAPATGDAFTVYAGCDHTHGDLRGRGSTTSPFPRFPLCAAAADRLLRGTGSPVLRCEMQTCRN